MSADSAGQTASSHSPGFGRRLALVVPILAACAFVDEFTKRLAVHYLRDTPVHSYLTDTFRLEYSENSGAFLSLGADLPPAARFWLLTVGVGAGLAGLLIYTFRVRPASSRLLTGMALVCAGGLCNWFDRVLFNGYVIDFMNVGIGWLRSGIFNVADLWIEAGAILILWDILRTRERPKA